MTPVGRPAHVAETGLSRLGVLILALFAAAAVFVGSQVFPFYYYYFEIEGLMQAQADKAAVFSDAEIRTNIMERVKKLQLPIEDDDDLKINRFDGKIVIELNYEEVLYLDLGKGRSYDLYVFEFHPYAEQRIGKF